MRISHTLLLWAWIFLLFSLPIGIAASDLPIDDINITPRFKQTKIAVVQFLPLPDGHAAGKIPHRRVFTDEIISTTSQTSTVTGDFVPVDYLEIINNNLKGLGFYYGLPIKIYQNIGAVPDDAALIVLGAVKTFFVGKIAEVNMAVRLLDGKTYKLLKEASLKKTYGAMADIPFIPNMPVHTVGNHANNFHPQRVVLNLATHACMIELLQHINEEIR